MPELWEIYDIPERCDMTSPKTSASEIIQLCCSKPKSQQELASILKMSPSAMSRRMKGLVANGQIRVKYPDMKHPVYGFFNTDKEGDKDGEIGLW